MYVSPFSQRVFTMVNDEISLMRARRKIQEILGKSLQGSFLVHAASPSFKELWSGSWVTQILELGDRSQLSTFIWGHMPNLC